MHYQHLQPVLQLAQHHRKKPLDHHSHKPVIDYKPQSASLPPTNPTASLMVSLVTVFSLLFVGEVVCIFASWQRPAAAAGAAAEALLKRFLRIIVIALQ